MARKNDFHIARMRKVERSINDKMFKVREQLIRIKELNDQYPDNDQLFQENLKVENFLSMMLPKLESIEIKNI